MKVKMRTIHHRVPKQELQAMLCSGDEHDDDAASSRRMGHVTLV